MNGSFWLGVAVAVVPVAAVVWLLAARAYRSRSNQMLTHLGGGGPGDTLRDALRRALSDAQLEIVYPRFGQGGWVNELGEEALAPAPSAGRVMTPIDRGGKPVAALIHDPSLLRNPKLLHAAAEAASLAIDNEQLKADLRADLIHANSARLRIIEAGDRELQRVERNLHDGAQQRLVGLALVLRLASRSAAGDATVTGLLDDAAGELDAAIAELRELTRGIHPAIVNDAGLADALEVLAERPGVPVSVQVDLPGRLPERVEVGAYYLVSEALTNTNKHARAQRATVRAEVIDGVLRLVVSDDGVGGAAAKPGSGLEGMADRVKGLGGDLVIDSAAAGGTVITADIPLAAPVQTDDERRRMRCLKWIGWESWEMPGEAFEQITEEDNLVNAKGVVLCAGGNAQLQPLEREWLAGYHTTAGTPEWVIEATRTYDDSDTLTELMQIPGALPTARSMVFDALRMLSADGPLTAAEIERVERAAGEIGLQREVVTELREIVLAAEALRHRRFDAISAPMLPELGRPAES